MAGYPAAYRSGSAAFAGYPGFQGGASVAGAAEAIASAASSLIRSPIGRAVPGGLLVGAAMIAAEQWFYNTRDAGLALPATGNWETLSGWCAPSHNDYGCGPLIKAFNSTPCASSSTSCTSLAGHKNPEDADPGNTFHVRWGRGIPSLSGYTGQKMRYNGGGAVPVPVVVPEGKGRAAPPVYEVAPGTHPAEVPIGVPLVRSVATYRGRVSRRVGGRVVPAQVPLAPVATMPVPAIAFQTKVGAKTKEAKVKAPSDVTALMQAHGLFMNIFTETADVVEAIWKALPPDSRRNCGKRMDCMLNDLYVNFDQIDVQKAAVNVISNQIEDMVIGKTAGTAGSGIGKTLGTPIGGGFGPIF